MLDMMAIGAYERRYLGKGACPTAIAMTFPTSPVLYCRDPEETDPANL
jgi:hypothetical protein